MRKYQVNVRGVVYDSVCVMASSKDDARKRAYELWRRKLFNVKGITDLEFVGEKIVK